MISYGRKPYCIRHAIIDKLSNLVALKAQYEALVLEHDVVTDHVIALATTARLEALDLALIRWEVAYRSEIKALEGVCTGAIPCGSQGWLDQR